MFPPLPTTPFRNSPSIDVLSPRLTNHLSHFRTASLEASGLSHHQSIDPPISTSSSPDLDSPQTIVGDRSIGSDVPVELLRSVMLSGSLSQSNQSTTSSASTTTTNNSIESHLRHHLHLHPPEPSPSSSSLRPIPELSSPAGLAHHPALINPTQPFNSLIGHWNSTTIAYTPTQIYPPIRHLPGHDRKRILVTGGAGFVGSHLVDRLMFMGHDVTVLDNFFSGSKTAVAHWIGHPNFELIRHDVVDPFMIECDQIYHLACPASPVAYQYNSIKTMKTNFLGTMNMLGLAKRTKARFLLSSTSEVYGSPEQHPQKETYWGHVNPIGPRACYDEGKRVAESLTYGYARENGVDVRVARIFNTYGPRMSPSDGRLVSNFIMHAIRGQPIEIYGDGEQTRSLMYIFDLVDGLIKLMNSEDPVLTDSPVNLGSTDEQTVNEWARMVIELVKEVKGSNSDGGTVAKPNPDSNQSPSIAHDLDPTKIIHKPALPDDPPRRKPDTTKAQTILGWKPQWSAEVGLRDTVRFFWTLVSSGYIS